MYGCFIPAREQFIVKCPLVLYENEAGNGVPSRGAGGWLTLPRRAAARASHVALTGATLRIRRAFIAVLSRPATDSGPFVVFRYRAGAGQRCLLGNARIAARMSEPRSAALVRVRGFVHVGSSCAILAALASCALSSLVMLRVRIFNAVSLRQRLCFSDGSAF